MKKGSIVKHKRLGWVGRITARHPYIPFLWYVRYDDCPQMVHEVTTQDLQETKDD